ncbi:hypothetical protein E9993_14655 [Labilibacter sediminis]|nr:hypothetical protein E9993_14655 [Labilibacter sediminis]
MKRHEVLKAINYKEDGHGKPVVFSIKFRTKAKGELIFMPMAIACGVKGNMSANRLRGVQAVDDKGNYSGHPTPVSIDRIVEFNGKKVYL